MLNFKTQKGFTLLELLVVISIIGILLAVAGAAFSAAQQQGRDSRRVSDMQAIQKAFEQYYATTGNGSYGTCAAMAAASMSSGQLPLDPVNTAPYQYTYPTACSATGYCVCAYLNNGTKGNSTNNDCNSFANSGSNRFYFCIENRQ